MNRESILFVGAALVLYLIVGGCSLNMKQEDIQGKQGQVWNVTQRAIDVLGRLEQQVSVFMADRKDVIEQITNARNGMVNAANNHNLQQLATAQQAADAVIRVIMEAYPDLSLTAQQTALMDETAGSINRIAYARQQLIDAQVGYNQQRIFFAPLQFMFPRIEVVGENFDPTTALPTSSFGTPAPAR